MPDSDFYNQDYKGGQFSTKIKLVFRRLKDEINTNMAIRLNGHKFESPTYLLGKYWRNSQQMC